MANERDDEQINETEGSANQNPAAQQGQENRPTGQQGQPIELGQQRQGGQPQIDTTGQSSSGQAQPSGGIDTATTDQSGTSGQGGDGARSGEGFIGSQSSGSDEHVEQGGSAEGETGASSAESTGGTDFAEKGQGSSDEIEDDRNSTDPSNTGGGGGF